MKRVQLDKYLAAGTTYTLESDRAYVIRALGTDSATAGRLYIDEVPLGEYDSTIAPLTATQSNTLGPLELGELFYVVPPKKKIRFEGASGSFIHVIGDLLLLDVNEDLPAEYVARFKSQGLHYWTLKSGTASLSADQPWPANYELTVITLTPSAIEMYRVNHFLGVSVTGGSVGYGQLGITFKLNDIPFDLHSAAEGPLGIDVKSAPLPPTAATSLVPFKLDRLPFDVPANNVFKIGVVNTSGDNLAPSSGQAWNVTIKAIVEYIRS